MASDEEITWAYRLFLDREPENREVFDHFRDIANTKELRSAFMGAAEFRSHASVAYLPINVPPMEVEWRIDAASSEVLLSRVREIWNRLGAQRPHWSVLSSDDFLPQKMHNDRVSLFNESGKHDAELLLSTLRRIGATPGQFSTLFEFGCGLARVTPHLARHFELVIGCDISQTHLREAKSVVARSGATNIRLVQAELPDFGMHTGYNIWFSRLVLQHNSPPLIAMILQKALQRLLPGGLAIFQVPTYGVGYRFLISEYLDAPFSTSDFEMHCLPQQAIFEIAFENSCVLKEVREDSSAGSANWISNWFCFEKRVV
jgi:SAM-dependent methyltransferase